MTSEELFFLLDEKRRATRMSWTEIGRILGVDERTIRRWEHGNHNPHTKTVRKAEAWLSSTASILIIEPDSKVITVEALKTLTGVAESAGGSITLTTLVQLLKCMVANTEAKNQTPT